MRLYCAVDPDLERGPAGNVLACLSFSLGNQFDGRLLGPDRTHGLDADSLVRRLPDLPVIVLRLPSSIKAWRAATYAESQGLPWAAYPAGAADLYNEDLVVELSKKDVREFKLIGVGVLASERLRVFSGWELL